MKSPYNNSILGECSGSLPTWGLGNLYWWQSTRPIVIFEDNIYFYKVLGKWPKIGNQRVVTIKRNARSPKKELHRVDYICPRAPSIKGSCFFVILRAISRNFNEKKPLGPFFRSKWCCVMDFLWTTSIVSTIIYTTVRLYCSRFDYSSMNFMVLHLSCFSKMVDRWLWMVFYYNLLCLHPSFMFIFS